jgi:hypothetical protein
MLSATVQSIELRPQHRAAAGACTWFSLHLGTRSEAIYLLLT